MAHEVLKRKLAAILSADVKEYSRLMSQDERGTIRTLTAYKEVMKELIQEYKGRVVDAPGDNLLAEFGSVVDAVNCAVEIQRELTEKNTELPPARQMEFRIGINLGDVVEEEERIYGDGVNIAARIEGLADGGGICISGTAYDQVLNKLGLEYEFLGKQEVKNIERSVRVYRVLSVPGVALHRVIKANKTIGRRWLKVSLSIAVALVVGAATWTIWHFYFRPSVEPASVDKMAYSLPDKPSIAVLPFTNMSDDPKQEYFADGITEDLITDLSQISDLFIIARNSTFVYKGKPVKIRQVAEELGVRYVLEGSVRKSGEKVRINTQLIDATTGHHLWAKRYDGRLDDIFALQDEITQKIVSALAVKLTADKQKYIGLKETENFEAYDTFLKGWGHYLRTTEKDFTKAISYFEKAIELDPNYWRAYASLALTHWYAARRVFTIMSKGDAISYAENNLIAQKYLQFAMQKPSSIAYQATSGMDLRQRRWQDAIEKARKAIDLDPNDSSAHLTMGKVLVFGGKPEEAIEYLKTAIRLDPHYPALSWGFLGLAYFCMGKYQEAATLLERSAENNPDLIEGLSSTVGVTLAAVYAHLGREQDAKDLLSPELGKLWGLWSLRDILWSYPFKNSKDAARLAEGLIKAGVSPPYEYHKAFIENILNGKEIKALIFGRKSVGLEGTIYRSKDGDSVFQGYIGLEGTTYVVEEGGLPYTFETDKGKSWIEEDMLCEQWQTRLGGMKFCYPIFKNPDVSDTMLGEYYYFRYYRPLSFSLAD